jgi:SecD/SecF fusion protein
MTLSRRLGLSAAALAAVGLALAVSAAGHAWSPAGGDKKAGTGPKKEGEILTYRVRSGTERLGFDPKGDLALLTENLGRRLNADGLYKIVVRPAGDGRLEVVLPPVGTRAAKAKPGTKPREFSREDILRIKRLISLIGRLEFRILANRHDDAQAIAEARELIAKKKEALDKRAERGQLPPVPTKEGTADGAPKVFEVKLARGDKSLVTYSWVELGKQEQVQLGLNKAARKEKGPGDNWKAMAEARTKGVAIQLPLSPASPRKLWQGALFYSRECKDRNLPEEERTAKKYEYFVLARNPEIDPKTGRPTPAIDGSYLVRVAQVKAGDGRHPAVSFTFNAKGGQLLHALTEKNVPSGPKEAQVKRHLAIILDELVVSAPTINSAIGQHGQIAGSFTEREVEALVDVLRAGALPAGLELVPPKADGRSKEK